MFEFRAQTNCLPEVLRRDLSAQLEACRHSCAMARTEERVIRIAFRQLRPLLDILVLDEVSH